MIRVPNRDVLAVVAHSDQRAVRFFEELTASANASEAAIAGLEAAGGVSSVDWVDVTGKPATFAPAPHSHAQSDVTGLVADLAAKQAALVSGVSLKTLNGESLLGSGDVVIAGGGGAYSPVLGWAY